MSIPLLAETYAWESFPLETRSLSLVRRFVRHALPGVASEDLSAIAQAVDEAIARVAPLHARARLELALYRERGHVRVAISWPHAGGAALIEGPGWEVVRAFADVAHERETPDGRHEVMLLRRLRGRYSLGLESSEPPSEAPDEGGGDSALSRGAQVIMAMRSDSPS